VVVRKVSLAGVQYTLSQPDKVRKSADEEAFIISRRMDMIPAIARSCANVSPTERAEWRNAAIEKLMTGIASPEEWKSYYFSMWELAFRFWNALDPTDRVQHAGVSGTTSAEMITGVEWAYEVIKHDDVTAEDRDVLQRAIQCVSQEEAEKNFCGSQQGATPATDTQSTVDTQPSSPS